MFTSVFMIIVTRAGPPPPMFSGKANRLYGLGLSFVCADPEYQGRGIGTQLTRKVLELAEEDNLAVYLESTDVAVSIYQRLGFRAIDSFEMQIPGRQETERVVYKEVCMIWYPSGKR